MNEKKTNGDREGKSVIKYLKCSTDSLSPKTLSLFNNWIKDLVPHHADNFPVEIYKLVNT